MAYVTKKNSAYPKKMKVRYISGPRNEANERLGRGRRPKCVIPLHRDVACRILYWKKRYPKIPILVSKRDFRGAFKSIPVSIRSLAYAGCRFAGYMVVYLSLFFGREPSPGNWGVISTLLMRYISAFAPNDIYLSGHESLVSYNYVDDGYFVDPRLGVRPWVASSPR